MKMRKITAVILTIAMGLGMFSMTASATQMHDMVSQPSTISTIFRNIINIFLPASKNYPTGIKIEVTKNNEYFTDRQYYPGESEFEVYVTSKNGKTKLNGQKYSYSVYKLDDNYDICGSAIISGQTTSSSELNNKFSKLTEVGNYGVILKTDNGGYMAYNFFDIVDKDYVDSLDDSTGDNGEFKGISYHHYNFSLYVSPDVSLEKYGTPVNNRGNTVVKYAARYIFENKKYQYLGAREEYLPSASTTAPEAPEFEGYTFIGWIETSGQQSNDNICALIRAGEELPYDSVVNGKSYMFDYYSLYVNNKTHLAYSTFDPDTHKFTSFHKINSEGTIVIYKYYRIVNNQIENLEYPIYDENGNLASGVYAGREEDWIYPTENVQWMGNYILSDEWLQNWLGYVPG